MKSRVANEALAPRGYRVIRDGKFKFHLEVQKEPGVWTHFGDEQFRSVAAAFVCAIDHVEKGILFQPVQRKHVTWQSH
jgi:hypothetical protein